MKKVILFLMIPAALFAGKFSQVEYNAEKTQISKYNAGAYFWGADTTTAKSDYGAKISSNGIESNLIGLDRNGEVELGIAMTMKDFENTSLNLIDNRGFWIRGLNFGNTLIDSDQIILGSTGEIDINKNGNMFIKGDFSLIAGKTVDGRDISVDGGILDGLNAGTTQYMHYSEYDPDKDGYVNKADSATFADNAGNYTPTADLPMGGFRVTGSSTIPYSPTSEILITAKYMEDNSNIEELFIGTTTKQTSSTTFVPLMTTSSMTWNYNGYCECLVWGSFYLDTSKSTIDVEILCSTDNFVTSTTLNSISKYVEKAADVNIDLRAFADRDFMETGTIFKIRANWKTDLGTITNSSNGSGIARVLRHSCKANKEFVFEEE